jgi:hypothetical protein
MNRTLHNRVTGLERTRRIENRHVVIIMEGEARPEVPPGAEAIVVCGPKVVDGWWVDEEAGERLSPYRGAEA